MTFLLMGRIHCYKCKGSYHWLDIGSVDSGWVALLRGYLVDDKGELDKL
jgi:hypothetical protein